MKILVIFTGGTIGSRYSGDYISPDGDRPYLVLDKYIQLYGNNVEWSTDNPYTILSENLTCKTLFELLRAVRKGLNGGYDGIIVTHGSDTLQYSAAFLSLMLRRISIPVILVAGNYVLEDSRSNGMDNFRFAVDFIEHNYGKGVFVSYKNTDENPRIYSGSNLMPHPMYSDRLESLGNSCFGEYICSKDNIKFIFGNDAKTPKVCDFEITAKAQALAEEDEKTHVLNIYACPGMTYPDIENDTKAVLLHPYHSGTICVESAELHKFMEDAEKKQVKVYLVGANQEKEYESCKAYNELGIKVLPEVSPVYAYLRLWLTRGKWLI